MADRSEHSQSLPVICLLSLGVGVVAGLGAWIFRLLIGLVHNLLFLGELNPNYNANLHTPSNPWGVGVIIVPVIGAAIVAWLVKTFAPEAKGHGVPEVMDSIYYNGARIRPIVAAIKSVASAVCIGSGGSVGREGPIIQIGSAFGSTLGQIVKLPARQRITLVAAGAAGGIAATFNAPLGGVAFAVELLLVSVNVRNLLPVGLATVTATYLGRALLGTTPSFDASGLQVADFHLESPAVLLLLIPFGILMGLASVVFVKGIYWFEDRFDAMPGNDYTRHLSGMLLVGLTIYAFWHWTGMYYVQGIGYATIMDVLTNQLSDPGFLLLLCGAKLITTCLTLGSGGSGGVFSPGLYMGATLGATFALLVQKIIPDANIEPVTFALAGMAAAIGATTGAMLTASIMLREMTLDNHVMLPIIVTTVVACGVRKWLSPESIYTLKLLRRGHVVPEGLQAALDDARRVDDVMTREFQLLQPGQTSDAPNRVKVFCQDGEVIGVDLPAIGMQPTAQESTGDQKSFVTLTTGTPLVDAIREMQTSKINCGLVFKQANSHRTDDLVGVFSLGEISQYRIGTADLFS